jgi:uncharacterized cupin superfamily protein
MAKLRSPRTLLGAVLMHARGRAQGIQVLESGSGAFVPRPIEIACIEEGEPVARYVPITESRDGRLSSGLWECTAGKFKVVFWQDEVVHILDGGVTVRQEGGDAVYTLGPGDTAYFPLGMVTHWDVPRFVRKFFVVRMPGGSPLVARARQRLAI